MAAVAHQSSRRSPTTRRLVVVDQGGGPYRSLRGRPAQLGVQVPAPGDHDDKEVELIGLVRIARRQPKFDFRAAQPNGQPPLRRFRSPRRRHGRTARPIGHDAAGRLVDEVELRDGFPKAADELYSYHAIIIDDLEAAFFTRSSWACCGTSCSPRGGGLLMLGGPDLRRRQVHDDARRRAAAGLPERFARDAKPGRAPAGAHPRGLAPALGADAEPKMKRTSDWRAMPAFQTLSSVGRIKPGAVGFRKSTTTRGAIPCAGRRHSARGMSPPS